MAQRAAIAAITVAGLAATALPAAAGDISSASMFRNLGFRQTGDGETLADNGVFFSAGVFTSGGNTYASGSLAFGGPDSPLPLTIGASTFIGYQSPTIPSKADMDAAFPTGTYTFTLQPTAGAPVSASFDLGADHYALSRPFLAGQSYSALQGMNAAAPLSLALSPFGVNPDANSSFRFFSIFDATSGQSVFNDSFVSPTQTTELLPAGLLQSGHAYGYELISSSRVLVPAIGTDQPNAEIGFELRTSGAFSTAAPVPEPSSAWLLLGGLGTLGWAAQRRRAGAPRSGL